jgi:hypothetical protein
MCARYCATLLKIIIHFNFLNNPSGRLLGRDYIVWCHTTTKLEGPEFEYRESDSRAQEPTVLSPSMCKLLLKFQEDKQVTTKYQKS